MGENKQYNIIIRDNHVVYNTKTKFDGGTSVKIPSYIIQDILQGNKSLLLKFNNETLTFFNNTEELKRSIITIESKIFKGEFRKEPIEYNLVKIKI